MSDPTGTSGARNTGDPDLTAALAGGHTFMQRLTALGNARDAHDQALADLNLGKTAAAAYAHAQELNRSARLDREAAAQALSEANSKSTATLNAARAEAARIVAAANAEAAKIKTGAQAISDAADTAAKLLTGQAQTLKDEAQVLKDNAEAERNTVAMSAEQVAKDRTALKVERSNFEAVQERFNHHYGRVATAMREAAHALV